MELRNLPASHLFRAAWHSTLIAGVVWLLLALFIPRRIFWPMAARQFAYAWIYSVCIGVLGHYTVPMIWHPVAESGNKALQLAAAAVALIGITLGGCAIAGVIFCLLGWHEWRHYGAVFQNNVRFALIISFIFGGGAIITETLRARLEATTLALRTQELERERAEKLAAQARLSSLESRVHPHFLFNALNSIAALIRDEPVEAERLVGRLASLLRFSLDASQFGLVPLSVELKIVEDYLAIEKARFGERLRYSLDAEPTAGSWLVPPLALQTLVENSVKYAVSARRDGARIQIKVLLDQGVLNLSVRDDGPGFAPDLLPAGHGLDNLHSRLLTHWGAQAALQISRENGWTVVSLRLPQSEQVRDAARVSG